MFDAISGSNTSRTKQNKLGLNEAISEVLLLLSGPEGRHIIQTVFPKQVKAVIARKLLYKLLLSAYRHAISIEMCMSIGNC